MSLFLRMPVDACPEDWPCKCGACPCPNPETVSSIGFSWTTEGDVTPSNSGSATLGADPLNPELWFAENGTFDENYTIYIGCGEFGFAITVGYSNPGAEWFATWLLNSDSIISCGKEAGLQTVIFKGPADIGLSSDNVTWGEITLVLTWPV